MTWAAIGRYVAALALGLLIAGTAQMWRYDAKLAEKDTAYTTELKRISDAAVVAADKALRRLETANEELAALDELRWSQLNEKNSEINRMRAGIADGSIGLRVNATCPASADKAGPAPKAGSVGDAASPRLTDAAERDYLALQQGIAQSKAMIEYLQGFARSCSATKE